MAQTTLNVRIDEDVKRAFEEFCSDVGMNISVAVNMFAKAVIREQRLPFEVTAQNPRRIHVMDNLNIARSDRQAGYMGRTASSVADEMERIIAEAKRESV
jgi:DNA-damage-inducible protein J